MHLNLDVTTMTEFENMTLLEIFKWLHDHDGWSKDWYDDELYPFILEKFNEL